MPNPKLSALELSIVIVNYNVKHFLEQCLCSVQKAIAQAGIAAEIFVVDNNSADGSMDYLPPRFPAVQFISNTANVGFAKANNQAIRLARGRYLLILNPDTLMPEDCFSKCIAFMNAHPDAGALGIRMVDGSGKFLKESKRAFPAPLTSLFRILGLARLFPRSPLFARYYLGHLDEHKHHEIDVLAGAFILVRKTVTDTIGGFDESFFMYGEDVDLSYRIQKAGYKNYYFADNTIIHFKGESTKKGSLNYVRLFHQAMSIFVHKHYGGSKAGFFNLFIQLAIWLRAGVSAFSRFIRWVGLPLLDAAFILLSFWIMKTIWNTYIKTDVTYENRLLFIAFPAFTGIYLAAAYFAGLYDKLYRQSELNRATIIATAVLLAMYALLPEQYRFSRGILVFGALLAYIFISWIRWLFAGWGIIEWHDEQSSEQQTVIVGSADEYESVQRVMTQSGRQGRVLGRVGLGGDDTGAIGDYRQLKALHKTLPFREVIFCEGALGFDTIIRQIQSLPHHWKIRFHAQGSESIVGSDSKDSAGEALAVEQAYRIAQPVNRRVKRLIDVSAVLLLLLTFPLHFLFVKNPFRLWRNALQVLAARKTWIGYAIGNNGLPPLRRGVLASNGVPHSTNQTFSAESLKMLDYWYARDYHPKQDWKMMLNGYRYLGNG